jgi:hypothetical protein
MGLKRKPCGILIGNPEEGNNLEDLRLNGK